MSLAVDKSCRGGVWSGVSFVSRGVAERRVAGKMSGFAQGKGWEEEEEEVESQEHVWASCVDLLVEEKWWKMGGREMWKGE